MLCYLFCYDIDDDRLRDRAAKSLLKHGQRVQESVFELWFRSPAHFNQLQAELRKLLPADSNLRWYRLSDTALADSGSLDAHPPRKPPSVQIW
ncbi:MAG: CRISPR-associated endonuclease Cas2 [Xanthomonadales bacterium]|nr:CRISPR-associated endonuclease Cas2 [Xanthomonadales bacterium]